MLFLIIKKNSLYKFIMLIIITHIIPFMIIFLPLILLYIMIIKISIKISDYIDYNSLPQVFFEIFIISFYLKNWFWNLL